MPSFCPNCGADEYICQGCGTVLCSNEFPPTWSPNTRVGDKVIGKIAANLCPDCAMKAEKIEKIEEEKQHQIKKISGDQYEVSGVVKYFSSNPKRKTSRGRAYYVRYMGVIVNDEEYLVSIYENVAHDIFGHYLDYYFEEQLNAPKSGSVISFKAKLLGFKPNFCDGMLVDISDVQTGSMSYEDKAVRFDLEDITFGNNQVILEKSTAKAVIKKDVWDVMTGVPTQWILNKVKDSLKEEEKKEAYITLESRYQKSFRYNRDNGDWGEYYYSNGDAWEIVNNNLVQFNEYVSKWVDSQRLNDFLAKLKDILRKRWMITDLELLDLIEEEGVEDLIDGSTAQDYLINEVWSKEYDKQYFNYLKEHGELAGVGEEGFFFKLNGQAFAFETPIPNTATYIFRGEPSWILGQIEAIKSQSSGLPVEMVTKDKVAVHSGNWKLPLIRLKNQEQKEGGHEFDWFIERAVHDTDGSAWFSVIDKYLED
jgi:hypothetical protein